MGAPDYPDWDWWGAAYLVLGRGTLSGTYDLADEGALHEGEAWSEAGWSVAGPGDVDGDGYDDILTGALRADGPGAAYLVLTAEY